MTANRHYYCQRLLQFSPCRLYLSWNGSQKSSSETIFAFFQRKKEKSTHYQKSSNCTVDNALKGQWAVSPGQRPGYGVTTVDNALKGQKLLYVITLLPFQGGCHAFRIPRALPRAMGSLAFQAESTVVVPTATVRKFLRTWIIYERLIFFHETLIFFHERPWRFRTSYLFPLTSYLLPLTSHL